VVEDGEDLAGDLGEVLAVGVRWIFLPTCSISGAPTLSLSFFICIETVGCVR